MGAVEWILGRVGLTPAQVDVFAVNQGPGSFTGLRIGISTAKGLASAADKPLVGLSTLEVLAHQSPVGTDLICSMIDARRAEVYWAIFQRQGEGLKVHTPSRVGPPEQVAAYIPGACTVVGNGVRTYAEVISRHCSADLQWVPDHLNDLCPEVLGRLAYYQWQSGRYQEGLDMAPIYIRQSDARLPSI
jgi:tRNA threonylcarbamoyladenosine biosynthesis protein TsaB